jgi:GNAT superfamily N-acetyltransferase
MYSHSIANLEDVPQIQVLMASSISTLLGELLNVHQLEAAKESMGLDTQLIEDGTYFLVKKEEELIGSGGYSYRKTLFGGNHTPNRSDDLLVPGKDAAKVRAMYTHPSWIRKGVGSYILNLAENSIVQLGFNKAELMATVSGILLYEKRGYKVVEEIEYESKLGNKVPMYKMEKTIHG